MSFIRSKNLVNFTTSDAYALCCETAVTKWIVG